ncbi:MAG: hypothetical protein HY510_01120 [Acidobacteria bacterium]|nr:hypothetical protein [Acidobacteriota bacterium]
MKWRRDWIAVGAALVLCGAGAEAQQLSGRVRETYQATGGGIGDAESVLQNYEINFRNDVARDLYWQARLRALLSAFDRPEADTDSMLLEPFVQVVYDGPAWRLSGGPPRAAEPAGGYLGRFRAAEAQPVQSAGLVGREPAPSGLVFRPDRSAGGPG